MKPGVALVVPFILFANGARLSVIHQLSARSSVSNDDSFDLTLRDDGGPPMEGCQANYFDTTCCCFVDAGILQQDKCECTDGVSRCRAKIRVSFHEKPSETFNTSGDIRWWQPGFGYLRGYAAVEKQFCMAAPVPGPQIKSRERAFECTCSTIMGANIEMPCGSGCDVENCKRWNPKKLDWAPFTDGRGKCCLSSFTSATKGCEQEVEPMTESGVKTVLSDALKHAARGEKKAFLLADNLVDNMTKSFERAKQKKVSTSRSGAEFFFSGDYGYILKSIHKPEYDVLYQITQPQQVTHRKSLLEHVKLNRQKAAIAGEIGNCYHVHIAMNLPEPNTDTSVLADVFYNHGYLFKGIWRLDVKPDTNIGLPRWKTFVNLIGNLKAIWCPPVSKYRILKSGQATAGCEHVENDALYRWLVYEKKKLVGTIPGNHDVLELHSDLTKTFEVAPFTIQKEQLKHFSYWCAEKWYPSSLINDFVLAFEYKSSTWMVVRNSVTAIRQELERHQFTKFHKEHDMFDVKPFPIHSDQREMLFRMQFSKSLMRNWENWGSVRRNLRNDVQFMNSILDDPMVDYSLLVSAFYIDDERSVLYNANLPNCVEERLDLIRTGGPESDYGDATGTILVCFNVIDMLMEFTFSKTPENLLLFRKWSDWGVKILNMFDCLGDPEMRGCDSYNKLRPKFKGVDIPRMMSASYPAAFVQDVTDMIDADGEMKLVNVADSGEDEWVGDKTYKCCCHSGEGRCQLAELTGKSSWSLLGGNPSGCGSLMGSGWHSYWRYAGHCRLPKAVAARFRRESVVVNGFTSVNL